MFAGSDVNAPPGSLELQHAIEQLKSLHDGDRGVPAVTACGPAAIPLLRALLFKRDPSGLYETRRRVVWALAALKAHDVLLDYLHGHIDPSDPVERLGDDAVVNAAASAVADLRSEEVFQLLMSLAHRRLLAGVIQALGTFQRTESAAVFIEALGEDDCRRSAEDALTALGAAARQQLIAAAISPEPSWENESVSSIRRRRSALALLDAVGVLRSSWPRLRRLINDRDDRIAFLACKLCLAHDQLDDRRHAVARLRALSARADWMLADDIRGLLAKRPDVTGALPPHRTDHDVHHA
jgi:hypothetical protein